MTNEQIRTGIAVYRAEVANIRYFLKEKRTIGAWQTWLWRRVPKLAAKTHNPGPSAMVMDDKTFKDPSIRYTNLLTLLCKLGDVERCRLAHTTTYKWVGE